MEEYSGQRKARPRRWGKVKHSGSLDTRARPRNSVEWGIQRNDQIKEKTFCHKYHFEVVLYKLPRSPQQNCLLLTSSTWAGREAMDGCVLGKYKLHHYQGKKKTLDIQLYGEWNFGTNVLPVKLFSQQYNRLLEFSILWVQWRYKIILSDIVDFTHTYVRRSTCNWKIHDEHLTMKVKKKSH